MELHVSSPFECPVLSEMNTQGSNEFLYSQNLINMHETAFVDTFPY